MTFVSIFRGDAAAVKVATEPEPDGGWQQVPTAGTGAIRSNDFRSTPRSSRPPFRKTRPRRPTTSLSGRTGSTSRPTRGSRTRPWVEAEGTTAGGVPIRGTQTDGQVSVLLLETPSGTEGTLENLHLAGESEVTLLGADGSLSWSQDGRDLVVELPGEMDDAVAHALRVAPTPWRLMQ